ncbi:MAG: hypothetical protein ACTSYL_09780 [Candidatus Thorarchaeota archaeon]
MFLQLDGYVFSIGIWNIILWGISAALLVALIEPNRREAVALGILMVMMSLQLLIISAPGYVLLYSILKFRDHKYSLYLLPLLAVIQEFLLYTIVIALLLLPSPSRRHSLRKIVICSILSACAYAIDVFIMGVTNAAPGGAPLITTFYVIGTLQTTWLKTAILLISINLIAFLPVISQRKEILMLMLLVAPIFIFGFFWEAQLWLPAMMIIICYNRIDESSITC